MCASPCVDHPRTRGVYVFKHTADQVKDGSSPHTRGLRDDRAHDRTHGGIIPAHAGFTTRPPGTCGRRWDHPRTRGVYSARSVPMSGSLGSSPHTRGLRAGRGGRPPPGGIIPAHAGFTAQAVWTAVRKPDHPRTRGVYARGRTSPAITAGSSPHTRGLRRSPTRWPGGARIIPAHAGFTAVRGPS